MDLMTWNDETLRKGRMSDQSATSHPSKKYWFLGAGGLLTLLWCCLTLIADPQWQAHLWPILLVTLAGFLLCLAGLLLVKDQAEDPTTKNSNLWFALSLLYPLTMVGLFIWASLHTSATLSKIITHPLLLVLNMTASLLIGFFLNRWNNQVPKGLNSIAWWLWQLPLVFINGTALGQYHFSNLLMILYLITILTVSFGLSLPEKS
jgi:FtsH-binding integral membrane protein